MIPRAASSVEYFNPTLLKKIGQTQTIPAATVINKFKFDENAVIRIKNLLIARGKAPIEMKNLHSTVGESCSGIGDELKLNFHADVYRLSINIIPQKFHDFSPKYYDYSTETLSTSKTTSTTATFTSRG